MYSEVSGETGREHGPGELTTHSPMSQVNEQGVTMQERVTTEVFRECDARELLAQIGRMNILAISGGRVLVRETGVTLPVGSGYTVTVDLAANDTYTVRRVFKRGAKVWVKGEQAEVYCDEVGEIAYQASSFRSYDFPKGGE